MAALWRSRVLAARRYFMVFIWVVLLLLDQALNRVSCESIQCPRRLGPGSEGSQSNASGGYPRLTKPFSVKCQPIIQVAWPSG